MMTELLHSRLFNFILLLVFAFLFFGGLYFSSPLLIPMAFASLLAMLLMPVTAKLEKWKLPKVLACLITILSFITIVAGIIVLLSSQFSGFAQDLPNIRNNLNERISKVQEFIHKETGVSPEKQSDLMEKKVSDLLETSGKYIETVFVTTTGTLGKVGIVFIYVFFFLFYRHRFKNFILKITPSMHERKTRHVINQISKVTQNYLTGVFIVMFILSIINTVGLLIVGLKHAVFFGVVAALLIIIPYIGTFLGGFIPTLYAFVTADSIGFAIATASVFVVSQFIESNFLTPKIVGGKVKINALAAIIALFSGGFIWGIAGMVLFVPFLGVAKIIFDNVEALKPFGYLIGDEEPGKPIITKIREKIEKAEEKQSESE